VGTHALPGDFGRVILFFRLNKNKRRRYFEIVNTGEEISS